jgi:hypothetical protein
LDGEADALASMPTIVDAWADGFEEVWSAIFGR